MRTNPLLQKKTNFLTIRKYFIQTENKQPKTMKAKKSIQVLVIVFFAFAAGMMLGLTLTNPGMSLMEAVGSIGRIDQYRNVRITEADIELRNELLSDENKREAYIQYLSFEYANNAQMADNISYALEAADASPVFRTANGKTLEQIEEYGIFLDNVRLKILEAMGVISELSGKEKVAVRSVLNEAGNAISQTITRSNAVFNFLIGVETFFKTEDKTAFPQLVNAHDRLFANLMAINMVNENRPVLEYLLAKGLMDEEGGLAQLDRERLDLIVIIGDTERLGILFNEETLQAINSSIEQLQGIWIWDQQQLQQVLRDGQTLNMEALRNNLMLDSERLNWQWI
jgi:hypothetical protein